MKRQLHVSGLDLLSKCGIAWHRRYVLGEKVPPGIAVHVGTGVHRSVQADLTQKMEAGALLPDEQIADLTRDGFQRALEREGAVISDDEDSPGKAADKAVRLAELHHEVVAPKVQPAAVEEQFVLDIRGYDFQLAGTIDVREPDAIRDTKTSKKSPSQGEAAHSLQLTAYGLATFVQHGQLPKTGVLDYLVDLKRGVQHVPSQREYQRSDFDPFLMRVAAAHRAIEAGAFVPARPQDWWCSISWCGYAPTCPYFLRPVSVPVLVNIAPVKEAT